MSDQLEPTTPPEELARANPNTITALWRIIQIGEENDRFEQAEIRLESRTLDTTGIEVVADEVRARFNKHATLRAEIAKQRRRNQQLEAENERLCSEVRGAYTMLDKYANEVSDEAYHQIESCLIGALDGGGDDS